jgi:protein gp37
VTVLRSNISWTTGTLNLTVGCTRVSAACDHCYANDLVHRLMGGGFFESLDFYPKRLNDLRKFAPARNAAGELEPKMVFVNSLSDFWHEKIPADFIHRTLDAFEQHPRTIMQILTKRPGRMRRFMFDRYANQGIPANIWLGVTCEDNRVRRGLDLLRDIGERVGRAYAPTRASVKGLHRGNRERNRKFVDSLLEGRVSCELVSEFLESIKKGSF